MSFQIIKNTYTFEPNENIVLDFTASDSVTYAYLYEIGEDTINSTDTTSNTIIFPAYKTEGTYTGVYVGTYIGGKWTESNGVTIIIKKKEVTPPPSDSLQSSQSSYTFSTTDNVVINLNMTCSGGYLYGVPNGPITCTNDGGNVKTFPQIKSGTYTKCYLGTYINSKWVQTQNFQITITENTVTPPPTPTPTISVDKNSFTFEYNQRVAIPFSSSNVDFDNLSLYINGVTGVTKSGTINAAQNKVTFNLATPGTYNNCYLTDNNDLNSNGFTVIVKEQTVTPPPTPDPLPVPTGNAKEDLSNAKSDFDTKYKNLVDKYNTVLNSNAITDADKKALDILLDAFKTSSANMDLNFTKASQNINSNKVNALASETNNKIAEIKTSINSIKASVSDVSTQVSTVESDTSDKITKIKKDLTNTNGTVDSLNNSLVITQKTVTSNKASVEILKNEVTTKVSSSQLSEAIANVGAGGINLMNDGCFSTAANRDINSILPNWIAWGDIDTFSNLSISHNGCCIFQAVNGGGVFQELSSKIISRNTEYTLSCIYSREDNVKSAGCAIEYHKNGSKIYTQNICSAGVNDFTYNSYTFYTQDIDFDTVRIYFSHGGSTTQQWGWTTTVGQVKLETGDKGHPWTQSAGDVKQINGTISTVEQKVTPEKIIWSVNQQFANGEVIKSANAQFDHNGWMVYNPSTGDYTRMDSRGLVRYRANGDSKGSYHYLAYHGTVSNVASGQTVTAQLPSDFCGLDYTISWWTGNIFPEQDGDLLFSANTELISQDKQNGTATFRANLRMTNVANGETSPRMRGKMNIVFMAIG